MIAAIIGLLLGVGSRRWMSVLRHTIAGTPTSDWGDVLLLAMTVGFVTAEHVLPPGKTIVEMYNR